MLALPSPAGHSGRSLTTTYETIAYHIHCSSSRRQLDDVMRQQEGIDDDNQLDVELNRGDHEEGFGRQERDDDEEGNHQEDLDQEEGGQQCFAICFSSSITVSYSVTVRFAALSRRA
jgi:hypothetical protein